MNVYNILKTQENTMDKDKGVFMTAREVNMEIEMLKTVFDIVRTGGCQPYSSGKYGLRRLLL